MTEHRENLVKLDRLGKGEILNGRYEILGYIGSGGFAEVYRGRDLEIERSVAIKVLNPALLTGEEERRREMLARFKREARSAARIQHPNIVTIFDVGDIEAHGPPYIVMELLDGWDLEDQLERRGLLPIERLLPLFLGALEALGEAHRLGIVHKDLKPSNLFLSRPGTRHETLKIVDFGIAGLNDEGRLTSTGQVLGTPQYLAPEYIETQTVSPALDVYQMGLILVELITGQPVVEGENAWQCALTHTSGKLEIPEVLRHGPLAAVIERALQTAPQARYEGGEAFADALDEVLDEAIDHFAAPVSTHLPSPSESHHTSGEGRRGAGPSPLDRLWPAAAILAVLLLSAVGFWLFLDNQPDLPLEEAQPTEPALDRSPEPPLNPAARKPEPEVEVAQPAPKEAPMLTVKLHVSPAGAHIAARGEDVGPSPVSFTFDALGADPIDAVITLKGYRPKEVKIRPDEGSDIHIALEKGASPRAKAPRSAHKPGDNPARASDKAVMPVIK